MTYVSGPFIVKEDLTLTSAMIGKLDISRGHNEQGPRRKRIQSVPCGACSRIFTVRRGIRS